MYNIGMIIYGFIMRIAALFNSKANKMIEGHKQVFGLLQNKINPNEKYIWIHAASLGEFEQGRPMIEAIRKEHPAYKIILTFFSPSGYEVRKDYNYADIVCYLPFDTKRNVIRFLNLVNPAIAIFIKYEFWLNYLNQLHERKIPTYIISTIFRPNQIFFKWYGGMFRRVLPYFATLFVQNEKSKQLLASIGIEDNVVVSGDTRFDRVLTIKEQSRILPAMDEFTKVKPHFLFVAGSTWPEDEDLILSYFNQHPEMKLILAPHEINDSHIQSITEKIERTFVCYSSANESTIQDVDCIIVDTFGILSSAYRYGDAAYIGGGFGVGIHNILEASVYGIPVVFGPNYSKFNEAKGIIREGGGFSINGKAEYDELMNRFMNDAAYLKSSGEKAGNYVSTLSGATQIVMQHIVFLAS